MRWILVVALWAAPSAALSAEARKERPRGPTRVEICGPVITPRHGQGRITILERRQFEPPPLVLPSVPLARSLEFASVRLEK